MLVLTLRSFGRHRMNYEKIYNSIISKAQSRDKLDGYMEKHHIIPRSFGGSDDENNIVALTAREHFLAHFCLWKFSTGSLKWKMAKAFNLMRTSSSKLQSRYNNSRLYSNLKQNLTLTPAQKIAKRLAERVAYWKARDLIESNT